MIILLELTQSNTDGFAPRCQEKGGFESWQGFHLTFTGLEYMNAATLNLMRQKIHKSYCVRGILNLGILLKHPR